VDNKLNGLSHKAEVTVPARPICEVEMFVGKAFLEWVLGTKSDAELLAVSTVDE
jgi:hypothetical protein